jgi:hypothetical protein
MPLSSEAGQLSDAARCQAQDWRPTRKRQGLGRLCGNIRRLGNKLRSNDYSLSTSTSERPVGIGTQTGDEASVRWEWAKQASRNQGATSDRTPKTLPLECASLLAPFAAAACCRFFVPEGQRTLAGGPGEGQYEPMRPGGAQDPRRVPQVRRAGYKTGLIDFGYQASRQFNITLPDWPDITISKAFWNSV